MDRKGEMWVLILAEAATPKVVTPPSPPLEEKTEAVPEVEKLMKAIAKTLAEAVKGVRAPLTGGNWPPNP